MSRNDIGSSCELVLTRVLVRLPITDNERSMVACLTVKMQPFIHTEQSNAKVQLNYYRLSSQLVALQFIDYLGHVEMILRNIAKKSNKTT